jgi:hypothetical protein
MATHEIAQSEWTAFLDAFSKEHQGLTATVLVVSPDVGAQEAAQGLPFVGISADRKGSAKDSITILLGTEADDHAEHRVASATHVWVKADGESPNDTLEIEAGDGSKTILQLHAVPDLPA